ncbi:ribosomal RNA-processing protein 7 homolog A [Synchiropus splendidus]|uniref:ribosomal RNA-processing protein 7 homolog A n=1 Tax=Synchiropus splendidus TaxID=270530 RepID=UPI00237ECDA3|nr:ribosomal RNA-processing protein 7 homolog A [Synchiropus splendidus]
MLLQTRRWRHWTSRLRINREEEATIMAPSRRKHADSCVIPGGFTVLSLKFDCDSVAQHKLFVKEHKVRAEKTSQRPLDRTLFVLNIPPYCPKHVINELFAQFGCVQSVELMDHPGSRPLLDAKLSKFFKPAQKQGFKVGYIVFEKPSSVSAAKSHPHSVPLLVSTEERPIRTGLEKWIHQYNSGFVQPDKLQEVVDSYMRDYDQKKEEEEQQKKKEEEQQQEDEDGWVKVTRGPRGAKARPHSEAANKRTLQKEIRKKKRKELMNFYSWQHKNTQKEHIAELRKKFEEDKQRIALLRAQRKFKPY